MLRCECGHTNEWDNTWKRCSTCVQVRGYALPPAELEKLSPAPSWHEKALREVQERKAREARREVIEAIRAYDRERGTRAQ